MATSSSWKRVKPKRRIISAGKHKVVPPVSTKTFSKLKWRTWSGVMISREAGARSSVLVTSRCQYRSVPYVCSIVVQRYRESSYFLEGINLFL
jgi:hypothetical protein